LLLILASPPKQPQQKPFRYSVIPSALEPDVAGTLLDWFEKDAPWTLRIAEFYEQHEFVLTNEVLPAHLRGLFSATELGALRAHVEQLFGVRLAERIDITAHRLTKGQRIRIHNDYIPGQETQRLLIQLNRGWLDENGGALMLFNSREPTDVHRILRPVHNSGLLFEISSDSLHAVTPINGGERFTLVMSFFSATQ
jgi:Rps23 Pro-64 3,4-dihydroxylase Tpa1-like proline 4-hydroxylase